MGGLNGSTKKYKVKDFIGNTRDKPDIIAVQEHKLNVFAMTAIGHLLSRDLHTICSPGQKRVRGKGTGGTALLIYKSFKIITACTSEDGWSAYEGDPRWARLDWIDFSHAGTWLAAVRYLHHHAGNTLSNHLPVSVLLEVGTVVCTDGRLSLTGPTTFKWSPSLLGKSQEGVRRIWEKQERRTDDPRKIYHKGTTQVRNFLRAKLSLIQELQQEIVDLHNNRPGDLTVQQLVRLDWLETEK
ncbi:hypothetical protein AXG93_402s1000 [Marchantia polymorpha subsp. ruderalis]|uniref:Endonuclease/exonuclease/phosphatase domain-containing protein n=1 Tax=Marchantia polymorpha subsp. ruderalis TaxID=1480154 RepID=A0A176WC24_MARPO|nr:hypothetical protein AXG93_402s1000 [Marchantia polymorpha subsp. ruderalis]